MVTFMGIIYIYTYTYIICIYIYDILVLFNKLRGLITILGFYEGISMIHNPRSSQFMGDLENMFGDTGYVLGISTCNREYFFWGHLKYGDTQPK